MDDMHVTVIVGDGDDLERNTYLSAMQHRGWIRRAGSAVPELRRGGRGRMERRWSSQVVALSPRNIELPQYLELLNLSDAFGDGDGADVRGEVGQCPSERALPRAAVDAADEGDVEFDDVWSEVEKMPEPGIPSAGVVGRQTSSVASHLSEGTMDRRVVFDGYVFGQLDDDTWAVTGLAQI
jgi:hypothetical protein